MNKHILFILLFSFNLFGQELNVFYIKPLVKVGTIFSGWSNWEFTTHYGYENGLFTVDPNINIGVGLETLDIVLVDNTFLNFRLEASYGYAKTKEVFLANSRADFQVTSIPIMFWTKLKSSDKISPYIKIGFGTENSEFKKSYYNKSELGFIIKKWFFCYGIGGGIDLNFFAPLNFSIFIDSITKENGFILNCHNCVVII